MDEGHPAIRMIVFIVLLIVDAVFSGCEEAMKGQNENHLTKLAEEGNKKAKRILRMMETPASFMNTIELVVTSVAMIVGAYVGKVFYQPAVNAGLKNFDWAHPRVVTAVFSILVTLFLIYLVLVAGIVVPKRVAAKYSERWVFAVINIVSAFMTVLWPLACLVTLTSHVCVRLFGIDPKDTQENVTEEDIMMMVSEGHEQGVLEATEAEMIHNIFEFNDKEVSDIMTHRKDIVGVDVTMEVSEAAAKMLAGHFSRYPVYEEDIENIIGILHMKDIMRAVMNGSAEDIRIQDIMRKPFYVPDTQNIDRLFREMQQKKMHMAIVIDEYGQTAGLVAMEDILEEIVGNIFDEYDVDEHYIQPLGENVWLMRGISPLDEVGEVLGVENLDDGDYDTLNGLLISRLEHIPAEGDRECVRMGAYDFEVLSVKNNMIHEVRVTKADPADDGAEDSCV